MVNQLELELTGTSLGLTIIHTKAPASYMPNAAPVSNSIKFLTLEKSCIKIWEYNSGNAELLKKI
jgi:hypothetical protein